VWSYGLLHHFIPEDGGFIFLRDVGMYVQVHTSLNPEDEHRQKHVIVKSSHLPCQFFFNSWNWHTLLQNGWSSLPCSYCLLLVLHKASRTLRP